MKGLKIFRVIAATAIFIAALLSFLNFSMGWETNHILHIQFVPALLSLAAGTLGVALPLIILLLLTLIFGRVYCSFLCPTGILQDIIGRLARPFTRRTRRTRTNPHSPGAGAHNTSAGSHSSGANAGSHSSGATAGSHSASTGSHSSGTSTGSSTSAGYHKPHSILRYIILIATGLLFALGLAWPLTLLDPYSLFGKIASQFFGSIEIFLNNALANIFPNSIPYLKYTSIATVSFIYGTIALVTLILFSAAHGRLYCNTICPVGTLLGLIGSKSLFQIRIDSNACKHCNACAKNCKSNCIDIKGQKVDTERCVVCFNCLQHCKFGALHYSLRRPAASTSAGSAASTSSSTSAGSTQPSATAAGSSQPSATAASAISANATSSTSTSAANTQPSGKIDKGLRTTLAGLAGLGTAIIANKGTDSRFIPIKEYREKHLPENLRASQELGIMPPGAGRLEHFKQNCTGCYACVAACPGDVIKPATFEYGPDGILLPTLKYNGHFCGYECNACSSACPSGALSPLTLKEKKRTAIGKAIYMAGKCIVFQAGTDCGACDEHCPTKAITMVPVPGKSFLYYPKLNRDLCIGCGGCEYICPQKPKAIKVVALADQSLAQEPTDDVQQEVEVNDFGF
ncbi:MAG: 4Fe-4S binding protein [Candidatus Egerieousia sp.]|nr:4Fe-4S binding protein [Candidatus Egerieousia sp.]